MNQMLMPEMANIMAGYLKTMSDKGRMCEIGSGFGESALFFSITKPEWTIYTIDGFGMFGDGRVYKELHADNIYKAYNTYKGSKNIIQILGNSQTIPWELPVDCIYLDADHRYEGVKRDFEVYSPWLKENGYIFFDDYLQPGNETNGVKRFVDEICTKDWELLYADITAVVKKK